MRALPALLAGMLAVAATREAAAQRAALETPAPAARLDGLSAGVPRSAVVVLDRDALFAESLFGERVARDIDAASRQLVADNRRIETELEAEEKALTARRETMDAGAFRDLAAEFDRKVTGIRDAQDAKARAISQQGDRAQQVFFEQANPVLIALAQETGALVILDRRIVIASADQIDITLLARARIDAALGAGDGVRPAQRPSTQPAAEASVPTPATDAMPDAGSARAPEPEAEAGAPDDPPRPPAGE